MRSQIESKNGVDYDRISIDLNRFKRTILRVDRHPKINKMNFKTVEVFVKNSLEETAYFDVRESDQPDDLFTSEADNSELLEELPSDEEGEKEEKKLTTVADTPAKALEQFAKRGDYLKFIEVIESLSDSEDKISSSRLIEVFLTLLANLVIKFAHIGKPTEASVKVITEEWPKLQTTRENNQTAVVKVQPEDNTQSNTPWTRPLPDAQEVEARQIDIIQNSTY